MEQNIFETNFLECLNKNFPKYSKYLNYEYKHFFQFRTLVFEITKCQILELNYATITLTNHLLERLLKVALISKHVGIRPIPTEKLNAVFQESDEKYGNLTLANSIELCKKENLINQVEKDFLFNTIRELMRNGFSHGDASKVLKDFPDEIPTFSASLSDPNNIQPVSLASKKIPTFQAIHIDEFARANAVNYFAYVFKLVKNIEIRLLEFDKATTA